MKKVISVTRENREFLQKAFGVTNAMVTYALTFHAKWGQSDLAKRIRSLALQRGGFVMVCAPASEVVHDAEGMMRQYFDNGWMWEADKKSGKLTVRNEKGDAVTWIEDAGVRDIVAVQASMTAMADEGE